MSQIAGVLQKMTCESCTLFHIMPFAKIIAPVEKKIGLKVFPPCIHAKPRSCCFHVFKGEI